MNNTHLNHIQYHTCIQNIYFKHIKKRKKTTDNTKHSIPNNFKYIND